MQSPTAGLKRKAQLQPYVKEAEGTAVSPGQRNTGTQTVSPPKNAGTQTDQQQQQMAAVGPANALQYGYYSSPVVMLQLPPPQFLQMQPAPGMGPTPAPQMQQLQYPTSQQPITAQSRQGAPPLPPQTVPGSMQQAVPPGASQPYATPFYNVSGAPQRYVTPHINATPAPQQFASAPYMVTPSFPAQTAAQPQQQQQQQQQASQTAAPETAHTGRQSPQGPHLRPSNAYSRPPTPPPDVAPAGKYASGRSTGPQTPRSPEPQYAPSPRGGVPPPQSPRDTSQHSSAMPTPRHPGAEGAASPQPPYPAGVQAVPQVYQVPVQVFVQPSVHYVSALPYGQQAAGTNVSYGPPGASTAPYYGAPTASATAPQGARPAAGSGPMQRPPRYEATRPGAVGTLFSTPSRRPTSAAAFQQYPSGVRPQYRSPLAAAQAYQPHAVPARFLPPRSAAAGAAGASVTGVRFGGASAAATGGFDPRLARFAPPSVQKQFMPAGAGAAAAAGVPLPQRPAYGGGPQPGGALLSDMQRLSRLQGMSSDGSPDSIRRALFGDLMLAASSDPSSLFSEPSSGYPLSSRDPAGLFLSRTLAQSAVRGGLVGVTSFSSFSSGQGGSSAAGDEGSGGGAGRGALQRPQQPSSDQGGDYADQNSPGKSRPGASPAVSPAKAAAGGPSTSARETGGTAALQDMSSILKKILPQTEGG